MKPALRVALNTERATGDARGVAQAYIANLKIKSIVNPALGDTKASKLTSAQVKQYIQQRFKKLKPSTMNRELGLLLRAFQLGYQQDPPLVGRFIRSECNA